MMPFSPDAITERALRNGGTSQQFREVAQNKANGFWIFLILAGIVWYFVSWMWACVPFAVALFMAVQSVCATAAAERLEQRDK